MLVYSYRKPQNTTSPDELLLKIEPSHEPLDNSRRIIIIPATSSTMNPCYHELDPNGDLDLILQLVDSDLGQSSSCQNETPPSESESPSQETRLKDHDDSFEPIKAGSDTVRFPVSSNHLRLASPVFKALLQTGFIEGDQLRANGSLELTLPDDDPDAMLVLLNIIHGYFRNVPHSFNLGQLC